MKNIDGAIVTTTTNNNYGNIVQRYALQEFLRKNNYNFIGYYFYGFYWRVFFTKLSIFSYPLRSLASKILHKNPQGHSGIYNYRTLSIFCNKRINQKLFLPFLHKRYKIYITGSDQNLGTPIKKEFFTPWQNFLLKFVTWDATRISYASSFGKGDLGKENDFIKSDTAKYLMQKFNAISIREKSGVEIAKHIWGIEARQVVDPALLLERADYDHLIDNPTAELRHTAPVFHYLLRTREGSPLLTFAQKIADSLKLNMNGPLTHASASLMSVEQWLKGFRDSQLVVTNSFHGVILSIIYNTNFVVLCPRKDESGAVRFQDLLGSLGLSDRVIFDDQFDNFDIKSVPEISWSQVNQQVKEMRNDSAKWLLLQLGSKS